MNKFTYRIMFDNGNTVTFDSDIDVNFHKIGVNAFGAGTLGFDDAFLNLQHVIFIDKEEKVEKAPEIKGCSTCKYETNQIPEEPCFSCIHGVCNENPNRTEKWEGKDETN